MREIRYALRTLARNRGLSLAAILVFALGIGANSAIFTVVRAVLLAPLPYADPDRLVQLYERDVIGTNPTNIVSAPNFYDWKARSRSFESMGYYGEWQASFSPSDGGLPENLTGTICDSGFFPTLGVQPALGRTFNAEDDRTDAARVAVINYALWQRRFSGSPAVLGSSIRLDGELHTVIGVMPKGFDYPTSSVQVWLPVGRQLNPNFRTQRGNHRFYVLGRLLNGVTVQQARTEVDGIAARIKEEHPAELTGKGGNVITLADRVVSRVKPMLLLLLGAAACVLLIACVNVCNLLLARAVGARGEVAIRLALGASPGRIVRQFLTESLLLSFIGAGLGLVLARFGTDVLINMAGYIPRIETARMNGDVLAFATLIAILTGIAVGVFPALTSSMTGLKQMMHEATRSATAGRGRRFFRDGLIAVEIALSLMLLVGAGLMLKAFAHLRAVDPGFVPHRILTIRFSLPAQRYKTPEQIASFYRELLSRVRTAPGIQSASIVTVPPLGGHFMDNTFTVDGRPPMPPGQFMYAVVRAADPEYFKSVGTRLLRGRVFTETDRLDAADKAVITEGMAAAYFSGEDPIGKRIRLSDRESYEIVGIVADSRQNLASPAEPMMYFPLLKGAFSFATLMVRASGDPNSLSLPLQKEMRNLEPDLPAVTVRSMDEMMFGSTQQNRLGLTLIALFAVLAVILASVGLYGVLAYSVGQRTGELGVRIALGADTPKIARLILWQGLKPASAGIVLGLAGSLAATRLVQTMLYDVNPSDPIVLAGVVVLLLMITLVACFVPAWRATRIDPVTALHAE